MRNYRLTTDAHLMLRACVLTGALAVAACGSEESTSDTGATDAPGTAGGGTTAAAGGVGGAAVGGSGADVGMTGGGMNAGGAVSAGGGASAGGGVSAGGDMNSGGSGGATELGGVAPNIIFIMADDMGWGDLSIAPFNQKKFSTPNLDQMAREGVRFTDFYSGHTVCAPARSVLLTGRHTGHSPHRGNADIPLKQQDVTVFEVLKGVGYQTSAMGKWSMGEVSPGLPSQQGVDEWYGFLDQSDAHRHYVDFNDVFYRNDDPIASKDVPSTAFDQDLFTFEALDFIRRKAAGPDPFFLYIPYTTPHAEMLAPPEAMAPFIALNWPEPKYTNNSPSKTGYRTADTPLAAYAAMMTLMDEDIGKILAELKTQGIDDNTIVFFTSDNGPHSEGGNDPDFFDSNGPYQGHKRSFHDGGIRVPMIVRWPGKVPADVTSDFVWGMQDFMLTAAELAKAHPPANLDGISVVPMLLGQPQTRTDFLYWENQNGNQAVRWEKWKGVKEGRQMELFDLSVDPGEANNVASANPEIHAQLLGYLNDPATSYPPGEYEHDPMWAPGPAR